RRRHRAPAAAPAAGRARALRPRERRRARGRGARARAGSPDLARAAGRRADRSRHAGGRRAARRARARVPHAERAAGAFAMSEVRMRALEGLPEIPVGDDLAARLAALVPPGPGILVVAQKVVSKAEGRLVHLDDILPSERAHELARELGKEPRHTELVL